MDNNKTSQGISRKDFLRLRFRTDEQIVESSHLQDAETNNSSHIDAMQEMELPPEFRSFYKEQFLDFIAESGGIEKIEQEMLTALWKNK